MNALKKDKLLFTPGPLTTSASVKKEMLSDYGSRDFTFINAVKEIRNSLLELGGVSKDKGYEAVLMQGSGTFGVEAVISCSVPQNGHMLLLINGAYGQRIKKMAEIHRIKTTSITYNEYEIPVVEDVQKALESDDSITHVCMVHCETTTGIFNELNAIGNASKNKHKVFIVDAMSSFGAVPIDLEAAKIDFLISSSNKCIEGVPGFSFVICTKEALEKCEGQSRTLSFDLYEQWKGLESSGQFRFTPPVQAIMAFSQAIKELKEEGGIAARGRRYAENNRILLEGMKQMGFEMYLEPEYAGYIINTFLNPKHPNYDFNTFYERLNGLGFVIYPGKLTQADCFRIGNIGRLFPEHMQDLLDGIKTTKTEMAF